MDESITGRWEPELGRGGGGVIPSLEPPMSMGAQQIPCGAGSGHAFALPPSGLFQERLSGDGNFAAGFGSWAVGLSTPRDPSSPGQPPAPRLTKNCLSQHLFPDAPRSG